MGGRERVAGALIALLVAGASHASTFPDPVVIYREASGHFLAGTAGVGVGEVAPGVEANVHRERFSTNDCHRELRFILDYSPENASADTPVAAISFPFIFEATVYDNDTDEPLPNGSFEWIHPGTRVHVLDAARDLRVDLLMTRGANVDWTFRIAGWIAQAAECRWQGLLFVNEVETNPVGQDAGFEWVEVTNIGFQSADLTGWRLRALHGDPALYSFPAGTTIPIGGRLVVQFPAQFLDNADEIVVLESPRGWEVDRTPPLSDDANDGFTWQRTPDGADAWIFKPGTKNAVN